MTSTNPDDPRNPWSAASGDAGLGGAGQNTQPYGQPTQPYAAPTAFPAYEPTSDPQPYAPPANYQQQPYGPVYPSQGPINPYGVGSVSYYGQVPAQHPQAVLAMVFGIIGLPFICFLFSIPAMIIGRKVQNETRAEPHRWSGAGMGTAGFILGVVSTVLWVGYLVIVVVLGATGALD